MIKQKKLTLQEYIQCHNIKKSLEERSRSKSRSRSHNHINGGNTLLGQKNNSDASISINQNSLAHLNNSQQQITKSIFGQIDFRAKNLYRQIQGAVNQIKLECRQLIKDDKNFAFFARLMEALMQTFRKGVMHIQRQNLILFQISNQADKNELTSKDQLRRTILQKSFDDKWLESKNQFQANQGYMPQKSIKQNMIQTRKGQDLIKSLFGFSNNQQGIKQKLKPKVYDHQPRNQEQRRQRKQDAVGFLGFIMGNINQAKKGEDKSNKKDKSEYNKLQQKQQQKINIFKKPQSLNLVDKIAKKFETKHQNKQIQQIVLKNHNQLKTEMHGKKPQLLSNQGQKIVRTIDILNSHGKVDIDTEQIDKYYEEHNMSFGVQSPRVSNQQIQTQNKKQKQNVKVKIQVKSPHIPRLRHPQKIDQSDLKIPHLKNEKFIQSKQIQKQKKNQIYPNKQYDKKVKSPHLAKTPDILKNPQTANNIRSQHILRRTNSKSNGKHLKGVQQKKLIK